MTKGSTLFPHQPVDYAKRKAITAKAMTASRLYRTDIERIVWKETNVPLIYCRRIIKEAIKQIVYHVALGHRFKVPWFGIFYLRNKRPGGRKLCKVIQFSPSSGMREDLNPETGEYRKSCLNFAPRIRDEKIERASTPVPIEKVPYRHRYVKSWRTEIEENLEQPKIDKWATKKRRKRCRRSLTK